MPNKIPKLDMDKTFTIKVTNPEGEKIIQTINPESDIYSWAKLFKVILNWVEFQEDTIKSILRGEYDEEWEESEPSNGEAEK